jgi:hypothetical protein
MAIRLPASGEVLGSYYLLRIMHRLVYNLRVQRSDELSYGYLYDISAYSDDVECADRKEAKIWGNSYFHARSIVMFLTIQEYTQR